MHDAGSPIKEPLITITPALPDDVQSLQTRVRVESDARARDRRRYVLLAIEGLTTPQIAQRIDRSRSFVQRWCYAYRDRDRDRGLEGLEPKPHSGRPHLLAAAQHQAFKQRIEDGPTPGARTTASARCAGSMPNASCKKSSAWTTHSTGSTS